MCFAYNELEFYRYYYMETIDTEDQEELLSYLRKEYPINSFGWKAMHLSLFYHYNSVVKQQCLSFIEKMVDTKHFFAIRMSLVGNKAKFTFFDCIRELDATFYKMLESEDVDLNTVYDYFGFYDIQDSLSKFEHSLKH